MPAEHPLTAFSPYLASRHRVLLTIAAEIHDHLDAATRPRASDLMWLWTLGAYELIRTICQAHACFAPRFHRAAADLRIDLERVRLATSKLEYVKYDRRDRSVPIPSDREPDLWDAPRKDLLVGDPANPASARRLLAEYVHIMRSLTRDEVLMRHEDSYPSR